MGTADFTVVAPCDSMTIGAFNQLKLQVYLVLVFEWKGKAVDDTAKNFEQLSNPIVVFCLEDKTVKDIIDSLSDERPVDHEFPIYPMQDSLEVVTLPRILRIKQL